MICVRSTEAGPIALPGDFFRPRFLQPSNAGYWRIDASGVSPRSTGNRFGPTPLLGSCEPVPKQNPACPIATSQKALAWLCNPVVVCRVISPTHAALMGHGVGCRFRRECTRALAWRLLDQDQGPHQWRRPTDRQFVGYLTRTTRVLMTFPPPFSCTGRAAARYRLREVGEGRFTRQPGQVRKEAALTGPSGSSSSLPLLIGT